MAVITNAVMIINLL